MESLGQQLWFIKTDKSRFEMDIDFEKYLDAFEKCVNIKK